MDELDTGFRRLADWLEGCLEPFANEQYDRVREEVPEFFDRDDPSMTQGSRVGTVDYWATFLAGLRDWRSPPTSAPPGKLPEAFEVRAANGLPWSSVLQVWWLGHKIAEEMMADEIELWDLESQPRRELLRALSRYHWKYSNATTSALAEVYQRERERVLGTEDGLRTVLIREILAGLPVSEERLGYRLEVDHVGLVAWGETATATVTGLAAELDCSCLTARGPGSSIWAWLGGAPEIDAAQERALASFRPTGETFLAYGLKGAGREGFAASHRQALMAYHVARIGGQQLAGYDEVALEALAMHDERLARDFALRELGPLVGEDGRARILRATLRSYLDLGQNAAAAAGRLRVSDRTVANRLSTVEDHFGYPVVSRSAELAVALRLYELYWHESAEAGSEDGVGRRHLAPVPDAAAGEDGARRLA